MPNQNRYRWGLVSSSGESLGDIDPPPSKINEFLPQWIRWIYNLYEYVGIINTNFLTVEDWHEIGATDEPAFVNNWANYTATSTYNTAAFYLDPFGVVHLKGLIENTAGTGATTTIFTLPTGYRPPKNETYGSDGDNAHARITIDSGGAVQLSVGTGATNLTLDGITFRI